MSYIANSINPDGVRAMEIRESLEGDIQEELGHAQQFAARIKELYGVVPGSEEFAAEQSYLQPPSDQVDIVHVIKGVIEAEAGAIEFYSRVIEETDAIDPVTQDMVIAILRDEQGHKRLFGRKAWPSGDSRRWRRHRSLACRARGAPCFLAMLGSRR
jgi:bacterioferritin